jgi:hypothetical protein
VALKELAPLLIAEVGEVAEDGVEIGAAHPAPLTRGPPRSATGSPACGHRRALPCDRVFGP